MAWTNHTRPLNQGCSHHLCLYFATSKVCSPASKLTTTLAIHTRSSCEGEAGGSERDGDDGADFAHALESMSLASVPNDVDVSVDIASLLQYCARSRLFMHGQRLHHAALCGQGHHDHTEPAGLYVWKLRCTAGGMGTLLHDNPEECFLLEHNARLDCIITPA